MLLLQWSGGRYGFEVWWTKAEDKVILMIPLLQVQVEVKRTKRPFNRGPLNDTFNEKTGLENNSGLSAKEIHSRSKMLQEGLAKTAAEAETIAIEKIEKTKIEEARIAANAQEASKAASSLAPKDKVLARRKAETNEILEIKKN